jgi:hypothetical protein
MRLITLLLNKLSLVSYKDSSSHIANMVAGALLCVLLVLFWLMASRTDKKLTFIIDEVHLGGTSTVTVGDNSGVSISGVPHDYLKITYADGAYEWEVNELYHDSLQYFKINNENPNKHTIRDDESQRIILRLPTSDKDTVKMEMTGSDVWKTWKKFKKQKDVLVRHFATRYRMEQGETSHEDSLRLLNQMQQRAVNSFFEHNDGQMLLVILDELTQLAEGGDTTRYIRSGRTSGSDDQSGLCKVQFFHIMDNCYMDSGHEGGYFQIDGVNYVMKPTVKLSAWGSGHVMLSHEDNGLTLRFPRPITYVGSVDSLLKKSEASSGIITLKQDYRSYPTKSDLYLPAFSSAINYDLCNIEFYHGKDSICVCDNNRRTHLVKNAKMPYLPLNIVPAFGRTTLQSGNDQLHCRIGYINGGFVMSYLWMPLLTCLLLLAMIWLPGSPVRVNGKQVRTLYNYKQVSHYPSYLSMLLLVSLAYCVCKSLIALKLSYTYPYFEKLTGITPVTTSLMMLLFFSLTMVINTPLLHTTGKRSQARKIWSAWAFCALMCGALVFVFFGMLDPMVNQSVIASYFHPEVYTPLPWKWLDAYGINDTHRSVVYALIFTESVVLGIWAFFNVAWGWVVKRFNALCSQWNRWALRLSETSSRLWHQYARLPQKKQRIKKPSPSDNKVMRLIAGSPRRLPLAIAIMAVTVAVLLMIGWSNVIMWIALLLAVVVALSEFVHNTLIGALKILFPGHLLLLLALAVIGNKFGNFGTAFISLVVILGMTHALSQAKIEDKETSRGTTFGEMFFITMAYIAGAMVGDNGYMTNYLGFVMCLVSFYFLLERPRAYVSSVKKEAVKEKKWVNGLLVFVLAVVLLLPMICSFLFSPEKVNYDRLARRVTLYSNFEDLERNGYRYNESDAEFMVIMSHYMQEHDASDPLSNDVHFLHPSISTGQSPVVLNDLSAPAAFFGAYGVTTTTIVFFILIFLLVWLVMQFSLSYVDGLRPQLTKSMQWRMLAMYMWVGTSFYIYLSYIDCLPYTGRLIPGMGVDAVGEALESAILLAFMAALTCRKKTN